MGRQQRRQRERRARQQARSTPEEAPERTRQPGRSGSARQGQRQPAPKRGQRRSLGLGAIAAGVAVIVAAAAALAYNGLHQSTTSATPTPSLQSLAPTVDGIQCSGAEQLVYHIHQHLTLYDHGKQVHVPPEIGIPGGENNPTCFYWIHVHAATPNIIHVESPLHKTFTLGNFFDVWKATKNDAVPSGDAYVLKLQTAAKNGQVTAFVNGKRWNGSYRSIPLTEHAVITVEIGKPVVPPKPFTAWNGL
jgi:hypothetical protein